jgi:hypothetical protein
MDIEEMRRILNMSQDEIAALTVLQMFKICKAHWQFSGKEGEPHALFTGNACSDNYFNASLVLQFPGFRKSLAERMVLSLSDKGINEIDVDIVVSSSFAAIPIGQEVAEMLNAAFVYTEKQGEEQVLTGRFGWLPEGARVLQVEEVITTIGTTERVRQAMIKGNPNGFEFVEANNRIAVATIVNCPVKLPARYAGYNVVPLMKLEVNNWTLRGNCPLCAQGSEALKPKQNWEQFSKYI